MASFVEIIINCFAFDVSKFNKSIAILLYLIQFHRNVRTIFKCQPAHLNEYATRIRRAG